MAHSAIPAVIAWLVDTFQAADTLGAADPAVLVLDGPEAADLSVQRVLWVAVSDPEDPTPEGALSNQSWAGLGAYRKDERLSVPCTVRASSGDADIRAVREAAYGIVGAVEDLLRNNQEFAALVLMPENGVDNLRLRTAMTVEGAIAEVTFTIDARARI